MKIRGEWGCSPPDELKYVLSLLTPLFKCVITASTNADESIALQTKNELRLELERVMATFLWDEPHELWHWLDVLNGMDSIFEDLLCESKGTTTIDLLPNIDTIISSEGGITPSTELETKKTDECAADAIKVASENRKHVDHCLISAMLDFTAFVLDLTFEKEVYSSTRQLMIIAFGAFDDDICSKALRALYALATPPSQHCCVQEFGRHNTSLHKTPGFSVPLFDMVDAAHTALSGFCLQKLLCTDEEYAAIRGDDQNTIRMDFGVYGVRRSRALSSNRAWSNSAVQNANTELENNFSISEDLYECNIGQRSLQQIAASAKAEGISDANILVTILQVRFMRMLKTKKGRENALRMQYQALAILLCCHSDQSALIHFLQDKASMLSDFMFLLRSGPGSTEYNPGYVALDIRVLVCKCLVAIVGSHDETYGGSILSRFSWLQNDMGVSRGQYMGLLPCLLRSATSYLIGAEADANAGISISVESATDPETDEMRLLWIEQILLLTMALISAGTSSVLPALTENGVLTSVLSVLKHPRRGGKLDKLRACVDSIVTIILDYAVTSQQSSLAIFTEQKGADICLGRLLWELEFLQEVELARKESAKTSIIKGGALGSATKKEKKKMTGSSTSSSAYSIDSILDEVRSTGAVVPQMSKVVIQQLFLLFNAFVIESRGENDHRCGVLLRSNTMTSVLAIIFKNPSLGCASLTNAVNLLVDAINNDPAPPGILIHLIKNDIAHAALNLCKNPDVRFNSDLCLGLANLAAALCLTPDGVELLSKVNPFPDLLSLLHNPKYYFPQSSTFMKETPALLGQVFEELIRHYPQTLPQCMDAIMNEVSKIIDFCTNAKCTEVSIIGAVGEVDNDKLLCFHYVTQILCLLEPLLSRTDAVVYILKKSGLSLFLGLLSAAIGPSRFVLANSACLLGVTQKSAGHYPALQQLGRCLEHVYAAAPDFLISLLYNSIDVLLADVSCRMDSYFNTFYTSQTQGKTATKTTRSKKSTPTSSSATSSLPTIRMDEFLDTVPLLASSEDGTTSSHLESFCDILREIIMIDALTFSLGSCILTSKFTHTNLCMAYLAESSHLQILERLSQDMYKKVQGELARVRGDVTFVESLIKADIIKKDAVMYKLMVIADNVPVKATSDDGSKRVCRLEKGILVDAYERCCSSSGILKYRTKHGWVGYQRSAGSTEPLVEVVDLVRCTREPNAEPSSVHSADLGNFSPRRSGFWVLFNFHSNVSRLLGGISKCLFRTLHSKFDATLHRHAKVTLPMLLNCIDGLCPNLLHLQKSANKAKSVLHKSLIDDRLEFLPEWFTCSVPSIKEFSSRESYLVGHTVEHLKSFCFDENTDSFQGGTSLIIVHTLYTNQVLERIVHATSLVFLCAMKYGDTDNELLERRRLSLSRMSSIFKFWRMLLQTTNYLEQRYNQFLRKNSDNDHDYDPIIIKRDILLMLHKYLSQTWVNPNLHTLPPNILRNLIEFMRALIFAVGEVGGALRSPVLKEVVRVKRAEPQEDRSAAPVNVQAPHIPDTQAVEMLVDMGFPSALATRAMAFLRTDDIELVANFLFDNPAFDFPEIAPAAMDVEEGEEAPLPRGATRSPMGSPRRVQLSHDTNDMDEDPTEPPATEKNKEKDKDMHWIVERVAQRNDLTVNHMLQPAGVRDGFDSTETSGGHSFGLHWSLVHKVIPEDQDSDSISASDAELDKSFNPLPLNPLRTTSSLAADQKAILALKPWIYLGIARIGVHIAALGCSKNDTILTLIQEFQDVSAEELTQEMVTMTIFQSIMKCWDKAREWGDVHVKLFVLVSLYERAIQILSDESDFPDRYSNLYGILHAIVLILFNKVSGGIATRTGGQGNELLYLLLTSDPVYDQLHGLLIQELGRASKGGEAHFRPIAKKAMTTQGKNKKKIAADISPVADTSHDINAEYKWVSAAVLILDAFSQPLLVDPKALCKDATSMVWISANDVLFKSPSSARAVEASPHKSLRSHLAKVLTKYCDSTSVERFKKETKKTLSGENEADMEDTEDSSDEMPSGASAFLSADNKRLIFSLASGASVVLNRDDQSAKSVQAPEPGSSERKRKLSLSNTAEESQKVLANQPLECQLLSKSMKTALVEICMQMLELKGLNDVTAEDICHAAAYSLAHLTRDDDIRQHFQALRGPWRILHLSVKFSTMSSVAFSLLLQILENQKGLQQAMQTAIKLCYMRLLSKSGSSSKVSMKSLVDVVSPLVYRDPRLFIETLNQTLILQRTPTDTIIAGIKTTPSADEPEVSGPSLMSVLSADATSPRSKRTKSDSTIVDSGDAYNARMLRNSKTPNYQVFATNSAVTHELIEEILQLIIQQYKRIKSVSEDGEEISETGVPPMVLPSDGNESDEEKKSHNFNSMLTLSDLLLIMADLTSTVPGLATCIHKFNLRTGTITNSSNNQSATKSAAMKAEKVSSTARVLPITHAITEEPLSSELFIVFLVHNLVLSEILPADEGADVAKDIAAKKDTLPVASAKRLEKMKSIAGHNVKDSAVYFLSALASIKGDGRRRILAELVHSMHIQGVALDNSRKIRAVTNAANCIQGLLQPPPSWSPRDTFIVPAKDICVTFCGLKTHLSLSKALRSLKLDHPMTMEATLAISAPLDHLIRKGLPAMNNTEKVVNASVTASGDRSSNSNIMSSSNDIQNENVQMTSTGLTSPRLRSVGGSMQRSLSMPSGLSRLQSLPRPSSNADGLTANSAVGNLQNGPRISGDEHLAMPQLTRSSSGGRSGSSSSPRLIPTLSGGNSPPRPRTNTSSSQASQNSGLQPLGPIELGEDESPLEHLVRPENDIDADAADGDSAFTGSEVDEEMHNAFVEDEEDEEDDDDEDGDDDEVPEDEDDDDDEHDEDDDQDDGRPRAGSIGNTMRFPFDNGTIQVVNAGLASDDEDEDGEGDMDHDDHDHDIHFDDEEGEEDFGEGDEFEEDEEFEEGEFEEGDEFQEEGEEENEDLDEAGDDDLRVAEEDDEVEHNDLDENQERIGHPNAPGARLGSARARVGEDSGTQLGLEDGNESFDLGEGDEADLELGENDDDVLLEMPEGNFEDELVAAHRRGGRHRGRRMHHVHHRHGGNRMEMLLGGQEGIGGVEIAFADGGGLTPEMLQGVLPDGAQMEGEIMMQNIATDGAPHAIRLRIGHGEMPQMLNLLGMQGARVRSRRGTTDLGHVLNALGFAGNATSGLNSDGHLIVGGEGQNGESSGVASARPSLHPLLNPSQVRNVNASTRSGQSGSFIGATGESVRDIFDFSSRSIHRGANVANTSERRRALGPIASDRRWGTDICTSEVPGVRLQALVASIERSLQPIQLSPIDSDTVVPARTASIPGLIDVRSTLRRAAEDSRAITIPGIHSNGRARVDVFETLRAVLSASSATTAPSIANSESSSSSSNSNSNASSADSSASAAIRVIDTPAVTLHVPNIESRVLDDISECRCPRDHEMQRMLSNPIEYNSADGSPRCDICMRNSIQVRATGEMRAFFHCTPCAFDLCMNCAIACANRNSLKLRTNHSSSSLRASNNATVTNPPMRTSIESAGEERVPTEASDMRSTTMPQSDTFEVPDGIAHEVWATLPLSMRLDVLQDLDHDPATLIQFMLSKTKLNREQLESLPPSEMIDMLEKEEQEQSASAALAGAENSNENSSCRNSSGSNHHEVAARTEDVQLFSSAPHVHFPPIPVRQSSYVSKNDKESSEQETEAQVIDRLLIEQLAKVREEQNKNLISTLSVTISSDRTDDIPPIGRELVARIFRCIYSVLGHKSPRPFERLAATACRFQHCRPGLLRAIFASIFNDTDGIVSAIESIPSGINNAGSNIGPALENHSQSQYQDDLLSIRTNALFDDSSAKSPTNTHRLNATHLQRKLAMLKYVLHRTDKLVWRELLIRRLPKRGSPVKGNKLRGAEVGGWMFGDLLRMLSDPSVMSSVNIDDTLHMLEAAVAPFAKMSITDANRLAQLVLKSLPTEGNTRDYFESPSNPAKRTKTEGESTFIKADGTTMPTIYMLASVGLEGGEPLPKLPEGKAYMPFPLLTSDEAKLLVSAISSENCSSAIQKRMTRMMRTLALSDHNWSLLLQHLSDSAARYARASMAELSSMQRMLAQVMHSGGDAGVAMASPELATPSSVSERGLLHVLRYMTLLRSKLSNNTTIIEQNAAAAAVAVHVRSIHFGPLWDELCTCLDIVRDLEGIIEEEDDDAPEHGEDKEEAGTKQAHKLSSLTMRFMPLIECFLSVCGATVVAGKNAEKPLSLGSDKKRRLEESSDNADQGMENSEKARTSVSQSLGSPAPSRGLPLTRQQSLPGARFRQHSEFLEMQVEVDEQDAVASRLIQFATKNRMLLNMVLRNNVQLLETSFSPFLFVPRCRQLLHFDIKRAFFKLKLKRLRQSVQRTHGSLRLNVSRQNVFQDSFQQLRFKSTTEMRRRLAITFRGEEGLDAGGLTREWYGVMAREIFNPNYALFCPGGDSVTFQPNPQSWVQDSHLDYFKFVGRVIGKSICDGQLFDAHFSRSFYKHILGLPVTPHDLESVEPEYYKTLKLILDTPLDMLGLDLTFTAETNYYGEIKEVELIPNGANIVVTDDNKAEYVRYVCHHRMTTSIREQIDAFLEGFHELVRPELVSIFDAQELELLISGLPDIDLDDMRAHTDYHGYKASDPAINWFWSILRSFSKEEKALFLQFVTGTAKVPLDGFKALVGAEGLKRFNIHRAYGENKLPSAHTCFNQLDLPEYPSEDIMKEKLLISIKEGSEGFGFA